MPIFESPNFLPPLPAPVEHNRRCPRFRRLLRGIRSNHSSQIEHYQALLSWARNGASRPAPPPSQRRRCARSPTPSCPRPNRPPLRRGACPVAQLRPENLSCSAMMHSGTPRESLERIINLVRGRHIFVPPPPPHHQRQALREVCRAPAQRR